MSTAPISRRDFLADLSRAAAAGGLALQLPWLSALTACGSKDDSFVHLTSKEARAMRAFAAQIIPSDDGTPGAEEAGAANFVDRALGLPFFAASVPVIRAGLADLDARARTLGARDGFGALTASQQIAVMKQIEHQPFFTEARNLVIIGTFADPSHGGNRNGVAWTMIGMEHRPSYASPYGWYDAQATRGAA